MKPAGSSSVMADRARGEVASDDPQTALYRKLEFFPTPPWAARAGGELIGRLDPGRWSCWEPAAGQGHMAHGLTDYFQPVWTTDIHDHGLGPDRVADFLDAETTDLVPAADWIITNPPFGTAAEFVRLGLQRARRGVAILARLSFFESARRFPLFFSETPLTALAPFFERVPMQLGSWDPAASTATAYAWFVWVVGPCRGQWRLPVVHPIPPGTRDRLTRPGDARLFGVQGGTPLFDDPSTPELET